MKKISTIILAMALLLTLTACDGDSVSSDTNSSSSTSDVSTDESSTASVDDNPLTTMTEWDYVSLVRDNYRKYFIASSSSENGLPNVSNNLIVRSLETAVSEDSTGKMSSLLEKFSTEPSLTERIKLTDEILNFLCKTDEITETSDVFSSGKLAILEAFWGTGDEFPTPTSDITAAPLEEAYQFLTERYCMAMIGSQVLPYIDLIGSIKGDDGKYHLNMEDYNKRIFEDLKSGKLSDKQLSDNVMYLAYYGVMKDKNLMMLEDFCEYAKAGSPESAGVINTAINEVATLFSGINDVTISIKLPETAPTNSGEGSQP